MLVSGTSNFWALRHKCCGPGVPRKRCTGISTQVRSAARSVDSIEDLMKAADELIGKVDTIKEAGGQNGAARDAGRPEAEEIQQATQMVCDETSCVIIPVAASAGKVHGPSGSFVGSSGQAVAQVRRPRDFVLSEGQGWKLGYDRDPVDPRAQTALVGSDSWSVSLTHQEFTEFVQLIRRLQRSIATLEICGEWAPGKNSSQEDSLLELQTQSVWMQARAPQKQLFDLKSMWGRSGPTVTDSAFHLRFIVTNEEDRQREFEGNFDPKEMQVVMGILKHLDENPPASKNLH